MKKNFIYLLLIICLAALSSNALGQEPPCQNTNDENYAGALKQTILLNDFVNISNGNFIRSWQDINIPGRGPSLNISRTYNAQIGAAVKNWYAESGAWNIENKEYSGEGDRSVLGAVIKGDWTISLKMKTVQKGETFPYETAWVNFSYADKDNRYAFLINTNGDLELVKYKSGAPVARLRSASSCNPLNWNAINITKATGAGKTTYTVTVNSDPKTSLSLADTDPLSDAALCLEAYFCHAHFDDIGITGNITYKKPAGSVFSQRYYDQPYADTGYAGSTQITYDFNFTTEDERSLFGYGWTWAYAMKLQSAPNNAMMIIYPHRAVETYTKNADNTYSPPSGVYNTLTANINDSDYKLTTYALKEKSGTKYTFDYSGRLVSVENRNSNKLTFAYNPTTEYNENEWFKVLTITDSSGRKLTLHYGANHKVDYIDDPANRRTKYEYDSAGQLTKVTDPMNNQILYTYYDNHNLKTFSDKEGHIWENTYYYNDRMKTQKDPLGNVTTYEYTWDTSTVTNKRGDKTTYAFDDKNRLKWSKDPYDKTEGIAWDADNNKTGFTDKLGNTTNFEYDAKGNQTKVIRRGKDGLEDIVTTSEYELNYHQPVKITDALGNVTELTYDAKGNLTKTTKYPDKTTAVASEMAYNSNGDLLTKKDPLNNITTFTYDADGNVTTIKDALNNVTTFTYDNLNRLQTKKDPKGSITTYTYDDNNNILTVTNALGHKVINTYDKDGRLLTVKDPNGQVTTYEYDALGNVIKTTDALTNFSLSEYDCANFATSSKANLISSTDANGHKVLYEYDKLNRLIKVTDPLSNQTKTEYDAVGNVLKATDANNHSATTTYDCFYRKASITDPLGRRATFAYDKMGNLTKATDANNNSTGYEYDSFYRRTVVTDTMNNITAYGYDKLGNLIWTRDPKGNIVGMKYDSLSRKTEMDDPDMGHWVYEYDANGNMIKQTDAKGQVLTFEYDGLNRLTKKWGLSPPLGTVPIFLAEYFYDDPFKPNCIGRLSKIIDQNCITEFFYDALGRQVKSLKSITGSGSFTIYRNYDKEGRLTSLTYPDNEIVTYTYDINDNIKKIQGASVYVSDILYTPTNQILKINYGNSTYTNYGYYDDNRLKTIKTQKDATILQDLTYEFDPAGNVTSIKDASHTNTQTFTYDKLYRLTEASGSYGTRKYAYDAIGNMLLKDFVNYTYGESAKFTPRSPGEGGPHAVTAGSDGSCMEYDANGNMSRKNDLMYEYDLENRLSKVQRKASNLATASTHLSPGWNFVSLPVLPDDNKIDSILKGLSFGADYDQVSRFNSAQEKFQHYVGDKQFNQFDAFDFGAGYQIYVKNPSGIDIAVTGKTPDRKFALYPAWNQIGATSTVSQTQALFLANLQYNIDVRQLSWYNQLIKQYQTPGSIDPYNGFFINGLKQSKWFIQGQNAPVETLASFTYDGDGGRVKKVTPNATTTYIGSLYEVTGSLKTKHIFMGPNRIASITLSPVGGEGQGEGVKVSYYHSDHLGSSNIITNQAGNLISNCEYLPYGEFATKEGINATNHYFTGKELDDETGLYYYGARYYDPQLGRFIQPDSIIPNPSDLQDFNRYSYCNGNPINYTDPTGHKKFKDYFKKYGSTILSALAIIAAPFSGGLSLAFFAASSIIGGVQAYQAGQFGAWAAGFAVSMALGFAIPAPNFSNLAMQVGVGALRGAAIGAVSGGIASITTGGDFWQGAGQGAIGGAAGGGISSFFTSQQMSNWSKGKGFRSDAVNPKITTKISTNNISEGSDAKMDVWIESEKDKIAYKAGDFKRGQAVMSIEKSAENINIDYGGDNKIDAVLKIDANNKPTNAMIHIQDTGNNIHWQDLNNDGNMQRNELVVK